MLDEPITDTLINIDKLSVIGYWIVNNCGLDMEKQTMVSCLEHDTVYIYIIYIFLCWIFHIYVNLLEGTLQKLGVEL